FSTPALEHPIERPVQIREGSHNYDEAERKAFVDVVEYVVAHLVSHDGLNFFGRAAAQQVVVERDAHGAAEAANIGAHACGLTRGVDLVHIPGWDSVLARQSQNGVDDFRVVEGSDFVEDWHQVNRRNHNYDDQECVGHASTPDPPGARQLSHDTEQQRHQYAAEYEVYGQVLKLIAHPGAEGLRGQSILVFAEIIFIHAERKGQNGAHNQVFDPVQKCLQRLEACGTLGQVAHFGRPAQIQQEQYGDRAVNKVPQDHPISALKISIGAGRFVGGNLREIGIGCGSRVKVGSGARGFGNLDDRRHLV